MIKILGVGDQDPGGQQRPVDGAVAAVSGQVNTGLVPHAGPVLALEQEGQQQVLIPDVGVVQGGTAPGRHGAAVAGECMGSRLTAQQHGPQGGPQLLLQGAPAVAQRKLTGQIGRAGVPFFAQFKGDLKGQRRFGHLVQVGCRWGTVGGEQPGQPKGGQVVPQGPLGHQHAFPEDGVGVMNRQLHQPATCARFGSWNGQISQPRQWGQRQVQVDRTGGQPQLP